MSKTLVPMESPLMALECFNACELRYKKTWKDFFWAFSFGWIWRYFESISRELNFLSRVQESQNILSQEIFEIKFRLLFRKLDEVNLFLMQIIQSFKEIWNKILRSQANNDWWLTNFCTQRIAWISLQTRSKILQDISTRIACLRWQSSMASKILLRRCYKSRKFFLRKPINLTPLRARVKKKTIKMLMKFTD